MKVLLLGSGGREHALARAICRDSDCESLTIAPGNPGTAALGKNVAIDATDPQAVLDLARQTEADLVVVGPEAPLVAGVADALRQAGFAVFGPSGAAARLEGSKAFAKEVMEAAGVPTAKAYRCNTMQEVEAALEACAAAQPGAPFVVKQDGLAAGKGVVVTTDCEAAREHAAACIEQWRLAGGEGSEFPALIVEEYLDGPEVSLFCLADGKDVVALPAAQDFKRVGEGNTGPNTGGMGAYSPLPWAPADLPAEVIERVALPVVTEMARRSTPFIGLLYCGLALTSNGLRVVEFNVRFGDPETQSVLERLDSSLLQALYAAATGRLAALPSLVVSEDAVVNVVLAAPGYPGEVETGGVIEGLDEAEALPGVHVIHAGTRLVDGRLVAAGGRVLSVVGRGADLRQARERAYAALEKISLAGGHYRRDIAQAAAQ